MTQEPNAAPAVPTEPPVNPAQPTQEPPPAPNPAAPGATPKPELPAEIQQRLAEADANAKRVQDLERLWREEQSRRGTLENEVQRIAGRQQQQDPLAPYVKQYADRGFTGEDAMFLAQRDYRTDQQIASLQNALTGQTQVPTAVQQAIANSAPLQSVAPQLMARIQQYVAGGQMDALNPEFIRSTGAIMYVEGMSKQPQGQTLPPAPPIPNFPSQFGPLNGFSAPAQPAQPGNGVPAHIQAMAQAEAAAVAAKYNFQPKTS